MTWEAIFALGFVGFIAWWLIFFGILRAMDRSRIRREIEGRGGRVVRIDRSGVRLHGGARTFDVEYVDADATTRRRVAVTDATVGVAWKDDPPGS